MPDCTYIPECAFYPDRLDGMRYSKDYMKDLFCRKQADACARRLYQHHNISREVPGDLMPHDVEKAREFMDGGG